MTGGPVPTVERVTVSLAAVAAAALLAQALPRDPAELGWTFLAMLLASGLSASVVASRAERRARRAEAARADVDRAFDALLALRSAYRRRADDDTAAPDDQTLFDLVDGLDSTARRVSRAAAAAAREYAREGVRLATHHPGGPPDQEAVAYDRLATALVAARNADR